MQQSSYKFQSHFHTPWAVAPQGTLTYSHGRTGRAFRAFQGRPWPVGHNTASDTKWGREKEKTKEKKEQGPAGQRWVLEQ